MLPMKNIFKNLILANILAGISLFGPFATNLCALGITLDPGHGGDAPGCVYEYDGEAIQEKDLNYKIALFIKDKLSEYKTKDGKEVKVNLTRDNENENPTLSERVELGVKSGSDIVISLHNNATASGKSATRGSMVLVTSCRASAHYGVEEKLGKIILKELNKIGLQIQTAGNNVEQKTTNTNGLLRRLSTDGSTYSNGYTTDWYGIISHGIKKNIPSILIEHAYLSNEEDYREFLSTDEKLKKLANADVKGIAKYYGLVAKK